MQHACVEPFVRVEIAMERSMLTYHIDPLDLFEGATVKPQAINSVATVVGILQPSQGAKQGFVWDPTNKLRKLPVPDGTGAEARAINDAGTVVGADDAAFQAYVWHDVSLQPTQLGKPSDLPDAFTHAINRYGLIGGGGNNFLPNGGFGRPILWSVPSEDPTEFGQVVEGTLTEVLGLNSATPSIAVGTGFWVSTDDLSNMVPLAGYGKAINDAGRIVGAANGVPAIFDLDGQVTPLPLPAPFDGGQANAVNTSGRVVGTMWIGPAGGLAGGPQERTAFLFAPSYTVSPQSAAVSQALIDFLQQIGVPIGGGAGLGINYIPGPWQVVLLQDLIDPNLGWQLGEATGVNDVGQIVGSGWLNGVERGFIMTPERHAGNLGQAIIAAVIMIIFGGVLGQAGWGVDASGHVVPIPGNNPEFIGGLTAATRGLAAATLIYDAAVWLADNAEVALTIRREALNAMDRIVAQMRRDIRH